jgi:DNA-directed RNA polymerase subunit RPC12/RpoP
MDLDTLLEMNPNVATVAKFMAAHPDIPVRFWENCTVDVTVPEKADLNRFLASFRCTSCGEEMEGPGIPGDSDVKGAFRSCPKCALRFFIHSKVRFGGTT